MNKISVFHWQRGGNISIGLRGATSWSSRDRMSGFDKEMRLLNMTKHVVSTCISPFGYAFDALYDKWYMIWYDMIWCDVMWCDYGMVWYVIVWYDMIWYMMWCDVIWYMIWCDVMWCDAIRYDTIWSDLIWYDMIWYDMTHNTIPYHAMPYHPIPYHMFCLGNSTIVYIVVFFIDLS